MPLYVYAQGLLYVAGVPHRRAILQAAGARVNVALGEPWGEEPPRTQPVFLSAPGGRDGLSLQAAFDRCRTGLSVEQTVAAQQTWMRGVPA